MHPLTSRWAALHQAGAQPVFVVTFLAWRRENWTADDYLGAAVAGFPTDLLGADATRGSLCSIRLRFQAPDQATAREWGEAAMREVGRMAHSTDAFTIRPGRMTAMERGEREM